MGLVVRGSFHSVHAAYQANEQDVGVSITSVYNKLQGIEPDTSAGLVRYATGKMEAIIKTLGGTAPPPLPGQLRRSLEKEKIDFLAKGNKFLHIADYDKAQQLLDQQFDTRFAERINSFLPQVFPTMQDTLGSYYSYYWTLWQSEWATDLVFSSPDKRESVMSSLLRYAHITGTSTPVLRCLDRPLTRTGNLINDQAIWL